MYCAGYLQTTHRRDLASTDLEAIWVQIKFPTTSAIFSVIYRSGLECPDFFEHIYGVFEKAWMKSDTIILLGDFNWDLQGIASKIQPKTRRLLTFFSFSVCKTTTKITPGSSTLIDLMVTTKPDLINRKGFLPLGISDHCLMHLSMLSRRVGGGGHFSTICRQIPCPRVNHSSQLQPFFPTPGCFREGMDEVRHYHPTWRL